MFVLPRTADLHLSSASKHKIGEMSYVDFGGWKINQLVVAYFLNSISTRNY